MSNAVVRALTNFQVHFGLMVSDIDQEVEKEVVIKWIQNSQVSFIIWDIS